MINTSQTARASFLFDNFRRLERAPPGEEAMASSGADVESGSGAWLPPTPPSQSGPVLVRQYD